MSNIDGFNLEERMQEIGEIVAYRMREQLMEDGHYETGALYDSIRSETTSDGSTVHTRVYADAQSDDGYYYAEFIEYGTGIHRLGGGGRQTPWKYQDRNGNWWTTQGMEADPFIAPAINGTALDGGQSVDEMVQELMKDAAKSQVLTSMNMMFDTLKYHKMKNTRIKIKKPEG